MRETGPEGHYTVNHKLKVRSESAFKRV